MPTSPQYITQLWASLADLDEMGPTKESLASKPQREKLRALRTASGVLVPMVRARYRPPLAASLEEVTIGQFEGALAELYTTDELPLTTLPSGSIEVVGDPTEATSVAVRALESGPAAGLPVGWSNDGGFTWNERDVGVLGGTGEIALGQIGAELTIAFSGTIAAGSVIIVRAGVEAGISQNVVNVAAYNLCYNRGINAAEPDGKALRARFEDAMSWAGALQAEKAFLDESRDATPNKRETRPRGGGQNNSWDWIDKC